MRPGSADCRGWWSNGRTCRHSSREPVAPSGVTATHQAPGPAGDGARVSRAAPGAASAGQHAGVTTDQHGHTHRLDLADSTVREWDAAVLSADPEQGIVLDRSAFYPGGGGQPPDEGVLLWGGVGTRIAGTRKGDELYLIP